jgi:flagellar L-ring protein precursor FlgH
MRNRSGLVAGLISSLLLVLAGCVAPSTSIQTPMTARPAEREVLAPHNGAIFQLGKNERPMFEDRRARNVGDVLTINIVEAIKANESTSNSASHAGSANVSTPKITGGASGATLLSPSTFTDSSNGSLENKSANSGANVFTGTITVTVVEVMPNGNLLVGGEKLMAFNHNNEYIRLSGVIDPVTISSSNTVQSTQVADAHLEYKGADNNLDRAQIFGMLGRAFLTFLPF